ncbi:MAG: hypothetical protein ACM3XM_03365 [Mycobacterium leprae]
MWPFSRKTKEMAGAQRPIPSVLSLFLDEEEVCTVFKDEVPTEKRLVVELSRSDHALRFIDSRGSTRSYDLASVYDEGARFLHLSVRVSAGFAVQADALLTRDGKNPEEVFRTPEGKGIRFAPFYLPECSGNPADLVGRGLFYRGLHFPGTVTPGNVSLLCICDHCHKSFRLQSFHAGFSDSTYLYCSNQPHTLMASSQLEGAPPALGRANPEALARFESKLPACEKCGGQFRYLNPLRCPHCGEPYIDFDRHPTDREQEYYGNYLYGDKLQLWRP